MINGCQLLDPTIDLPVSQRIAAEKSFDRRRGEMSQYFFRPRITSPFGRVQ
ncbi:MAG TPA: hypothetical protein VF990_09655 [Candidatus Dormibacteraeota bacterium]